MLPLILSLERYAYHLALHSFPTRRSSDLGGGTGWCGGTASNTRVALGLRRSMETDGVAWWVPYLDLRRDRKSTRLNSSHLVISYAVFCLKKKNIDAKYNPRHSQNITH